MTDAHVRFTRGWDATVLDHIAPDRVLAGAIVQANSDFVGYGCRLVVPFMGTYWNKRKVEHPTQVQIAACPATVMSRDLFDRLGGYDEGMVMYGAAEPEFSLRAWLGGAEILLLPDLLVEHRFKPQQERVAFVRGVREHMVANACGSACSTPARRARCSCCGTTAEVPQPVRRSARRRRAQ